MTDWQPFETAPKDNMPMTAAEGYLLSLFMEIVKIAQEALKEKE